MITNVLVRNSIALTGMYRWTTTDITIILSEAESWDINVLIDKIIVEFEKQGKQFLNLIQNEGFDYW